MEPRRFYILTGGTLVHVAPHFAICAPAYGRVGEQIAGRLSHLTKGDRGVEVIRLRTRMALGDQAPSAAEKAVFAAAGVPTMETNEDVRKVVAHLVSQRSTRCIVMAAAVCDWQPSKLHVDGREVERFGKDAFRLQSSAGEIALDMNAADKIVRMIRQERKDVFLVAFKATAGLTRGGCYAAGLALLKRSSANLVLANDVHRHLNLVVTPEEFPYHAKNRKSAVKMLCEMIRDRTALSFVRTDVRDEQLADVEALHRDRAIPQNFVPVLRHLIERGAYKAFIGKTAGHFGCQVLDDALPFQRLSSLRKVDHNDVLRRGMAKIYGFNDGRIVAGGAKPSVGEHTQHRIYQALGDEAHSIVHFHCPLCEGPASQGASLGSAALGSAVPSAAQRPFECGSVECGENTARHMRQVAPRIYAVHLEGHGPNIAFHKDATVHDVIAFIEQHFVLDEKTGGILDEAG